MQNIASIIKNTEQAKIIRDNDNINLSLFAVIFTSKKRGN